MKALLLLISFYSLHLYSDNLYTIQKDETVYSISKKFNIEIKDIFRANKEIGLNPDFIKPGQIIYIPESYKNKYKSLCSPYGVHDYSSHSLKGGIKKNHESCMNFISNQIDTSIFNNKNTLDQIWETFSSDIGYSYYLIHKFGELTSSSNFNNWSEVINDPEIDRYVNLIIDAAHKGSELELLFLLNEYFFNDAQRKKTKGIKYLDVLEQSLEEKKEFCFNNLDRFKQFKINNLKFAYLSECASIFYNDGETFNSLQFDEILYESLINFDDEFLDDSLLSDVINFVYRSINSQKDAEAIYAVEKFIESLCKNCEKFKTKNTTSMATGYLYNAFVEYNNNKNPIDSYFWYGLYMLDLNYSSAIYSIKNIPTKNLITDREHVLYLIDRDIKGDYFRQSVKNLLVDASLTIKSDTGLKLLERGECIPAKEYLDDVFLYYMDQDKDYFHYGADDIFSEPLLLMNCFANKGLALDYNYYEEYLAKAESKFSSSPKEIYDILQESIILTKDIGNSDIRSVNKLIERSLKYSDTSLNITDITYLDIVITNLYKIAIEFNDEDILNNLFKLNLLKKNFVNENIFLSTLSSNNSIKKQIKTNDNRIKSITAMTSITKDDYEEIISLINLNKELLSSSLEDNTQKENYYKTFTTLNEIVEKLDKNEYVIQFVIDEYDGGIVTLTSSEYIKIFPLNNVYAINNFINDLNNSLNFEMDFDFEKSHKIYESLLKEPLKDVPRDSTIYILAGAFDNLAPNILVKEYDDNLNKYEKLFNSSWLIKDYYFVRLDLINNSKSHMVKNYSEPFLGYGNSSTLNWVGLPNLKEVNDEIINLALSSNANSSSILIDNLATKENFLKRIEKPTNKIVISTHAVPKNWLGLTNEPSLVFNSYQGDIFLTPSEIIELDLNTEMLVLSSCNANTKGFNKIPKAFLSAGAESIVYTNWNLESKFAGDFTGTFFKNLWYYKTPKHIAIRETSLKFLNDFSNPEYSHPSFWGNFSIVYSDIN